MKPFLSTALLALAAWSGPALAQPAANPEDAAKAAAPAQAPAAGGEPATPSPLGPESQACLECHGEEDMEVELKSGETKSLFVDAAQFGASVHAKRNYGCTDCHVDLKGVEGSHPKKRFKVAREFVVNYSEQCQRCHFANYAKTLDSVHHAMQTKGNIEAAVCADCHGAHDVAKSANRREDISKTCARCHKAVSESFVTSVHGKGLSEGNKDVPACTDCHRSHDIADPRSGAWKLKTPEICGSCHTNEAMMKKYGLSTKVLQTYLSDFHGMTASLQASQKGAVPVVALCTDCHGVHDIAKVKDPKSKVMQANLVKTCQKCHPDAGANFPAAWLSHYEPSLSKAPLVYGVKLFYTLVIPFMIGGLVLQVILHLWRVVVNR